MKRYLLIAFCSLLLFACSEEEQRPADVIDHEAMVAVMLDVQLLEGAFRKHLIKADNTKQVALEAYVDLYSKHGLTVDSFMRSYDWYLDKPERMSQVMEDVMEQLQVMQAELGGPSEEE